MFDEKQFNDDVRSAGGIDALAQDILSYAKDLKGYDPEDLTEYGCDEPYGDIRLQYMDGEFYVRTGDSQYDTDHRGFWGASSVSPDCTMDDARSIAADLIDQCAEDAALECADDMPYGC